MKGYLWHSRTAVSQILLVSSTGAARIQHGCVHAGQVKVCPLQGTASFHLSQVGNVPSSSGFRAEDTLLYMGHCPRPA